MLSVILVTLAGATFVPAQTPAVAGSWVRQSISSSSAGAGANIGWGVEFTASIDKGMLTVEWREGERKVAMTFRLDGTEVVEKTSAHCPAFSEVGTKALVQGDALVITETGLVRACHQHGHSLPDRPTLRTSSPTTGPGLISVTNVSVTGDELTLAITKAARPNGVATTELRYRRKR